MNEAYARWNQALCESYFPADSEGLPAYLALDDDELAELAPTIGIDPADAAESLAGSVLLEKPPLRPVWAGFLFVRSNWRKEGAPGCPPYLAVLGLCVLAASRMASDEEAGIAANAYYPQLNLLIGEPVDAGQPEGFELLKALWEDLGQWLDDDMNGERGSSTARTHSHYVHIGWPLSQCLLRAADRNRLPDFFRSARLDPGTEVAPERLFAMLQAWASRTQSLTARARRVIETAGPPLQGELAEIVQRELSVWDGSLRDARGRRRAEILVRVEKLAGGRRVELALVAHRPEGFPEGTFFKEDGTGVELEAASSDWYHELPLKLSSRLLNLGILIAQQRWALSLEPSPVVPLRTSFEQGAWLEVQQVVLLEEHMILARADFHGSVERFLSQNADHGWRHLTPKGNLPRGWVLFDRVRLKSAPTGVGEGLERLVPRLHAATHLEGGLPLTPGIYLTGGEPDLWVDVNDERGAEVEVLGTVEAIEPGIRMIALSPRGFGPGAHQVRAAGVTRNFATVDTFGQVSPDGAGTFAHVVRRHKDYRPHALYALNVADGDPGGARLLVSGARVTGEGEDLPEPAHPPVVVRRGWQSYRFLGSRPGEIHAMGPPAKPRWLLGMPGKPGCQFIECVPPFPAEIMIVRGQPAPGATEAVPLVRPVSEQPLLAVAGDAAEGLEPRERLRWAEAILGAADHHADVPPDLEDAWRSYCEAAANVQREEEARNGS